MSSFFVFVSRQARSFAAAVAWLGPIYPGALDDSFTFTLPQARVETMLPLADDRILLGGHMFAPW